MRNVKVVLELEKVIPLKVKEGQDPKLEASRTIDELIEKDKSNDSFLSSFAINEIEYERIEESLIFTLVKKAIDFLDPYFVHPDSDDEYDGESRRIAEKIKMGMSVEDMAEIMKEEFNWSFSADFTRKDFFHAAETVSNLLGDCLNKSDINEEELGKKEYVYVRLFICKVIPVKVLDKEDASAKAIRMIFDKIDYDKELESFLSSFNISVGWATREISY